MEQRHLLPDEIDLLLDGEVGFGVQPLQAHVRQCAHCRAELEEARALAAELERLPRLAPWPGFADRVMAQVQVFEPWHVAALDTARRLVPRSRPARVLAAAAALSVAFVMSVLAVWLALRMDLLVFAANLVVERAREAVAGAAQEVLGVAFGAAALETLQSAGPTGLLLGAMVLLVSILAAAASLRALAGAARRRRG